MANLPITPLPLPPTTYDQLYFNQLLRTLNLYFRQIQNPGALLGTTIQLSDLPTSPTGLPPGSVWVDTSANNVLKVVL